MKLLHQSPQRSLLGKRKTLDFPVHLHNALELVLVRKGTATVILSGGRLELSAGDLFLSFPMQVHGYENSRDIDAVFWLIPMNPYLAGYRHILEQKVPKVPVLHREQWESSSVGLLLDMAVAEPATSPAPIMQGYLQLIIGKILDRMCLEDSPDRSSDAIGQLLLFLNTHYREPLTRQQIARAVGYNESYISHLFTDVLQMTLTDYLTTLRLEEAAGSLRETALPVSRIALDAGFGSIRSFHRSFCKKFGVSPTNYRKN